MPSSASRVQELPTAYKSISPCRLPLTRSARQGCHALRIAERTLVGRGHVPAACRNYQVRTDLFKPTVCRFAVGLDMSKPYRGCFVYRGAFFACGLRGAQRRGNLVQELPTAYKPVPPYHPPLTPSLGTHPLPAVLFGTVIHTAARHYRSCCRSQGTARPASRRQAHP